MRRNIISAAFAALGAFLLCSCAQELTDVSPELTPDGQMVITAAFPEVVYSKVDFAEQTDGTGLDLTWEEEDYLTVVSGDRSEKYTVLSIDGKVAKFVGNPVEGETFDVILSRSDDYSARTYAGQTQQTVVSTDHLLYDAVLKGVNTCEDVAFTAEWAAENGGTFAQNGCLMLNFKMPEDAGYLKSVTLTAPEAVFYTTNSADAEKTATLSLALADADMAADNVVEAYIMTSMQEASVAADTELTLTVVSNLGTWSKKFTPGAFTLKTGMRNVITLNEKNWTVPAGDGSEASPYILRTVEDLMGIAEKINKTETKYFAMVNDIDMTSITEWISINEHMIDFNGNNRTLSNFTCNTGSYRGFVRILNGNIYDLTFTDAKISADSGGNVGADQPCGIVAGYCGNAGGTASGEIWNVHVQGEVEGNAGGVGGLVGAVCHGKFSRCSADVVVKNRSNFTGGLIGYHNDKTAGVTYLCEITDCWTSGSVTGGAQKVGGIIGALHGVGRTSELASVRNSYSTSSVKASIDAGGIVANACNAQYYSAVEYCIAWNPTVEATDTKSDKHWSGAVVGCSKNQQTLTDCVRRSDMTLTCPISDFPDFVVAPYDQENTKKDARLPYSGAIDTSWGHAYPYHGKAAAASETVSDVAKRLGWDEKIWDLSGDYPQLIK